MLVVFSHIFVADTKIISRHDFVAPLSKTFLYDSSYYPYLTHDVTNKNLDKLVLLYKIISQNSKTVPALFQLNYMNKYFQIMKI